MTTLSVNTLRENVARVQDRIDRAASVSGRDPTTVKLISVSKTFPVSCVETAWQIGLTDFGENRVQEAQHKMQQLSELPIKWHLIGHLQSNKTRIAATQFDWIHSVDNDKILRRIDEAAIDAGTAPRVLLQVDLAGETTKHGAKPDDVRRICEVGQTCKSVKIRGLMLMPPWHESPEMLRPYFRRLSKLRDTLVRDGVNNTVLSELSMGMSHDLDIAIEEGATMIRVGTAIFGLRTGAGT